MQRNTIAALKVVGMSVFAFFISFFVYISLFVVIRQISTEVVGYTLYEITEDGQYNELGLLEERPLTLEDNQNYTQTRSEMSKGANALLGVLQVICGVGIVFCVVGSVLAKEAAKDRNDVDFNGAKPDKMRGFKIGALASVPALAINILAIVLKVMGSGGAFFYWVYRWMILSPVKPIVDLLTGNAARLTEAPLWSVIALIGFTVILGTFCGVMYMLCYNEDSVIAKVLYKSTKKKKDSVRRLGR